MIRSRLLFSGALLFLSACLGLSSAPEPDPVTLRAPAPPPPKPGEIRVFGPELSHDRGAAVIERLRRSEGRIVAAYEGIVAEDPYADGTLQLRIAINRKGEVAEIEEIVADVNNDRIAERVPEVIREIDFDPGAEAFAFYTLSFQPRPFEVVGVRTEFEGDPPALAADVLNRSPFRLDDVLVTVSVQRPDRAGPIRVSRRRIRAGFEPYGRRVVRVPVGTEWATSRYSFLVDVRPAVGEE